MGRRGVREYRPHEALALIAADREHAPMVCPSCGTRSIVRLPRRRPVGGSAAVRARRITLTCSRCNRRAVYLGLGEPETKGGSSRLGG